MHPPIDPMARFGAIVAMMLVVGLVLISAYDHRAARTVEASGPALVGTPRLPVIIMQTAPPVPTDIPAPTATPLPPPEPVVVYVEVPVVEYVPVEAPAPMPATLAPPPAGETVEQRPAREGPPGRFGGRPNLNPGPPDKAPAGPEAVGP